MKKKKLMVDMTRIFEMGELRALSDRSLNRPLSDKEYKRMMELAKRQLKI